MIENRRNEWEAKSQEGHAASRGYASVPLSGNLREQLLWVLTSEMTSQPCVLRLLVIFFRAKRLSNLTHIEKQKLERELGMGGGYVLDFSNRKFEEFFRDVVGGEIYDPRYNLGSGSKANRMRAFWQHATEDQLRALLNGLREAWELYANVPIPESAKGLLQQILNRLGGNVAISQSQQDCPAVPQIDDSVSAGLMTQLIGITALPPQKRGYAFERFLKDLFDAYQLSACASFRLTGEQIDGSFVFNQETYLLEAKWENCRTGAADLYTFEGKLRQKANWSRGLFVSVTGFSPEGLQAFGRGKRIVCMDGFDLCEMLRLKLSFVAVFEAKVRRAAETGDPHVSVRDLFL